MYANIQQVDDLNGAHFYPWDKYNISMYNNKLTPYLNKNWNKNPYLTYMIRWLRGLNEQYDKKGVDRIHNYVFISQINQIIRIS